MLVVFMLLCLIQTHIYLFFLIQIYLLITSYLQVADSIAENDVLDKENSLLLSKFLNFSLSRRQQIRCLIDPMLLEVFVLSRGAMWYLCQAPAGESQHRPLRFWGKATPSAEKNCTLFKKQPLERYWALVDTGHVTMGHQVSLQPAVFLMNYMLLHPPSLRFSGPSSNLLQDGIVILQLGSEVTEQPREKVAVTRMSLTVIALMMFPQFTPVALWRVPYDGLIRENKQTLLGLCRKHKPLCHGSRQEYI